MTDKQIIIDAFNSAWNRKVATENSYGKLASKEVFENNNEDKQIIMDGVDVSGCEFLRNCIIPDNYGCKIDDSLCCDVGNCYYKQLKRKEQECEELRKYHNKCCEEFEKEKKEWLEKYNQVSRDFWNGKYCNAEKCQQLDQLKKENEMLEAHSATLDAIIETGKVQYKALKQTLAEINEIAYDGYNNGQTSYATFQCEKIINKINEVEDGSI